MKISVIIPVKNEPELLHARLVSLQGWRQAGHELIVIEAGKTQLNSAQNDLLADYIASTEPGRALQMNAGAGLATGDVLLFLHVDTILPVNALELLQQNLAQKERHWGRFDVRLSGRHRVFRLIEVAINIRSHLTGVATGDQAIFVRREVFESLDGYAAISLMEDVELSKRLRRLSWPVRITSPAVTSSRRWEQHGVVRTVLAMWWLRLCYFLGASPEKLARLYHRV